MIERRDLAAIITAAGTSTRMGQQKALLPFNGVPLIDHQLARLRGFRQVIVVTGHGADALTGHLGEASCVYNPRFREGRSTSIEVGAKAVDAACRGVLVAGVDQPLIEEVLLSLLGAFDAEAAQAALPVCDGRRGHPLLFSHRVLASLARCGDYSAGLRDLLASLGDAVVEVPVSDPRIHADLNTPDDLRAAELAWLTAG